MSVAIKSQEQIEIISLALLRYKIYCRENVEYIDWLREPPDRIVNHIIFTHHAYVKHELPTIGQLLFNVLRKHGKNHQELFEIYLLFNDLKIELETHIVKEEELIFPAIMLYKSTKTNENRKQLLQQINEIEGEHPTAGDIIRNIRMLTKHFTLPRDACKNFELSYKKLAEVENDIFQHMHIIKLFYLRTLKEYMDQTA